LGYNNITTFYTLEGNKILAERASENFKSLGLDHIEVIQGNFDDTLELLLAKVPEVNWVFFDGNHRKEATLRYFHQCLEKISDNAIFIFDDINWSGEMMEAWETIKASPKVSITIDLFFMGLVFFEKRNEKEHFVIRF